MSFLPQYQKDINHNEESVPLWSADENAIDGSSQKHLDEDPSPAYPPRSEGASGSNTSQREITYVLHKEWSDNEEALGLLGRTKEETISIIKRGFPSLQRYPNDRLEFYKLVEPNTHSARWVRIFDEIWDQTMYNTNNDQEAPVKHLKVKVGKKVASSTEMDLVELEKRKWICFSIMVVTISLVVVILVLGIRH